MNKNIILNIDITSVTSPFLRAVMKKGYVNKEDLYPFIDQYIDLPQNKGSQLGAIALNTFCQYSSVDSEYMTDYTDIIELKVKNGDDIEKDRPYEYPHYRINTEFGIDPWKVWVDRCHERGCEAWISIRMNDAHDNPFEECLKDTFAYRAKWKDHAIGDRYGYFWKCLNYAHEEVRERFLGYIQEQLERYDMDALELDFMREIYCFDYINDKNCADIMTGFMREVRRLTNAAEEKRGHKIKVSARVPREIDQCFIWGFDVAAWAKENLVDHLTVTPRWETSDSHMPINEWRQRFPNVEIAAGVETLLRIGDLRGSDDSAPILDADMVNGLAANYFSQGADQIYLYNYFLCPKENADSTELPPYDERTKDVLSRCGDVETVLSSTRRHVVMYQDIAPEGIERFKPLPLQVNGKSASVTVPTGTVPKGKNVTLLVGFAEGTPESTEIAINGVPCNEFAEAVTSDLKETNRGIVRVAKGCIPEGNTVWKYTVTLNGTENTQTVTFRSEKAVISHVEIRID